MDEAGNVKPDRKSSTDKIDGVAAVTTAIARAMTAPAPRRSAYEDHGVQAV
jgi:phage terminase large subunit-like protein